MFGHLPDHGRRPIGHDPPVADFRGAALPIVLRQAQGWNGDLVVEFVGGLLVDISLGDLHRLLDVAGEQTLIEALLRCQNRIAPKRTPRNSSWGTYRPMTTRQTVSGVDRNRPTGPQSVVQNTAAMMIAKEERPVLEP